MKFKVAIVFLLLIIILIPSCDTTEPPPPNGEKPTLTIKLEDASCTETWIELTTTNLQLPATLILYRDSVAQNNILCYGDTLLYIDSLLPNTSYNFHTVIQSSNHSSNELSFTTMDTTSHNFSFISYQFGEHSSSVLYDVAIINENSIYAVGEIYMNDSLGQPDPTPYNATHWNGTSWDTMRIPTKTFSGTTVSSVIRTIFAFNENDIWTFSIAGSYSHWNGSNWETEFVNEREGTGNKLWGESSSNLYLVCAGGGISHYDGTNWQRIESGTDTDIRDIWGITDISTSSTLIYSAVSNIGTSGDFKILRINNSGISSEKPWSYNTPVVSIWFKNRFKMYACGGIVAENNVGDLWEQESSIPDIGCYRIRATDYNDVYVVGGYGLIAHFNGISWKVIHQTISSEIYYSCEVKSRIMCAVGINGNKAEIVLLRRQK
jgi:hypothetical protein